MGSGRARLPALPKSFAPCKPKAHLSRQPESRYRLYIAFRTVVTPRWAGEDSCSTEVASILHV